AIEGEIAPGAIVELRDGGGRYLARGYFNPRSKIVVRVLTRRDEPIDQAFWTARIAAAQDWRRQRLPDATAYRLVHADADGCPGLIVDRYGETLVVQVLTLGISRQLDAIVQALIAAVRPAAILERSDVSSRALEGLEPRFETLYGRPPDGPVEIEENGLRYRVDLATGQKTGYFFDQRLNRLALAPYAPDANVLDAFCNAGGFALNALRFGARAVHALDISGEALAAAAANAALNGLAGRMSFAEANAFDALRNYERERRNYDLVILDPPAFTKRRDRVAAARRGYKEINLRGLRLLAPGGVLVTCSCSHHLSRDAFEEVVLEAAHDAGRRVWLLERRGQSPDHPVLAGVPESEYLKCLILRVVS
ncbi:MAG TPA: class I SAM-dependent rRNA methyltransferase, partial [Limnochordia bacterium]|nr:class I SAM-dependent rRNA methyltransferase [Limnochordia bacterium]